MIKSLGTRRLGTMRYSSIELLATLILLFFATPFVEDMDKGEHIEAGLFTVVMISAGLAVGGRRKILLIAGALLVPTLIAQWSHHIFPELVSPVSHLVMGILFMGFVLTHLLRYILLGSRVNAEVLCAGISVYLLIGLLWTLAYMLTGHLSPSAFTFVNDPDKERTMTSFNAFYFSFTTLSTVGFGDITPVSKVARTLAIMEAITGMFYVAILISRLVSMYAPVAAVKSEPDRKP